MKLNNLNVTRYNTGYLVEITAFVPVRHQFTDALVTGEGHDLGLVRSFMIAWRDLLKKHRELNNLTA